MLLCADSAHFLLEKTILCWEPFRVLSVKKVEKFDTRYTCMHTCTEWDTDELSTTARSYLLRYKKQKKRKTKITEKFSETFSCLTEFLSGESQRWSYHHCDSLLFATQRIHIRWVAKMFIAATRWNKRVAAMKYIGALYFSAPMFNQQRRFRRCWSWVAATRVAATRPFASLHFLQRREWQSSHRCDKIYRSDAMTSLRFAPI